MLRKIRLKTKYLRGILFAVVFAAAILRTSDILSWKDTMGPYLSHAEQLYATEDGLMDVLFVGSSHVYGGIDPDVLWEQHGIASFDLACSGQDKQSAVRFLKEALKTQDPKVVFVDLYAVMFEKGAVQGNVYRNMLSMELSPNSAGLVYDYFGRYDPDYILRWPIVHTRYRELQKYDFVQRPFGEYGRGFFSRYEFTPLDEVLFEAENVTGVTEISETNKEFIDTLRKLSGEHGFSLVLMMLPGELSEETQMVYNGVYDYADSLGIPWYDFNRLSDEVGLDLSVDFLDHGHLNIYGAQKLSTWLGELLKEGWDLPDHRGDAAYQLWDKSAAYQKHLALQEYLPHTDDLTNYVSAIGATQDAISVITLQGMQGEQISREIKAALQILQVPEEVLQYGGTCVMQNGQMLAWLPPGGAAIDGQKPSAMARDWLAVGNNSIDLDLDRFHTLHIENSGSAHPGVFYDLAPVWNEVNGLGIFVYDPVLQERLDQRVFP